jgi:hypothetical protein
MTRLGAEFLVIAVVGACSVEAPAPKSASHPEAVEEEQAPASFEQSVGAMSDHDVDRAFRKFEKKVARCVAEGASRVEAIGGRIRLELRISRRGDAKSAHLSESTLGDRETERCILDGALARRWPKAKGGVGEASHEYAIESSVPVTEWQSKRLRPVMSEIHKKVAKCVMPLNGKQWQATLYIKRNGRVASSGVAPPTADASEQADCLVKELNRFRFGPQRSKLTKVSFTIP